MSSASPLRLVQGGGIPVRYLPKSMMRSGLLSKNLMVLMMEPRDLLAGRRRIHWLGDARPRTLLSFGKALLIAFAQLHLITSFMVELFQKSNSSIAHLQILSSLLTVAHSKSE